MKIMASRTMYDRYFDWRMRWSFFCGRIVCLFKGHEIHGLWDDGSEFADKFYYHSFCPRCLKFFKRNIQ